MAEDIKGKLERYRTAPFDSRFPNTNQTKNCWQNYLGKATKVIPLHWVWRVSGVWSLKGAAADTMRLILRFFRQKR